MGRRRPRACGGTGPRSRSSSGIRRRTPTGRATACTSTTGPRRGSSDACRLTLDELFRATTSRPSRRVTVLSGQLRQLPVAEAPGSFSTSVDRLTRREILLAGLGDVIRFARDPAGLRELVADRVAGWHPDLRELIAAATPAATFALTVRSALACRPWTPSPVTVLGDAIHAMAPSRGSGANLALRDAGALCAALTGPGPVTAAIGAYEAEMTRVGFAAVRASLKSAHVRFAGWRGASTGRDVVE